MLTNKADVLDYPLLRILSRIPGEGNKSQRADCMKEPYVSLLLTDLNRSN